MAVNLGTRGVAGGRATCSSTPTTRAAPTAPTCAVAHGADEPYGIKLWCLGNEMDGPWQVGHKTADEYGRLAAETAQGDAADRPAHRAGRLRQLQLGGMPTFGAWEATVLEHAYEHVDYISLHAYYEPTDGDLGQLPRLGRRHGPASSTSVVATADHVGARSSAPSASSSSPSTSGTSGTSAASPAQHDLDWARRPRCIEDELHRRRRGGGRQPADHPAPARRPGRRVACQAQLVNVIAPIRTEPGGAGLAADHLPPVRADRPARPGHRAARRAGLARATTPQRYGDVPVLDAVALTTRSPASWPCSRSTAAPRTSRWTSTCGRLPGLAPVAAPQPRRRGRPRTRSTPRPSPTG